MYVKYILFMWVCVHLSARSSHGKHIAHEENVEEADKHVQTNVGHAQSIEKAQSHQEHAQSNIENLQANDEQLNAIHANSREEHLQSKERHAQTNDDHAQSSEELPRKNRQAISEQSDPKPINATGTSTRIVYDFTKSFHVGLSCSDIRSTQGATRTGVYLIHPQNLLQGPWKVFCDMESEGGGWTVFQVRDDVTPHENFNRNWEDYKVGFGDFDREFWLGNILLWALTNADNETQQELHIELEDWSGNKRFSRYGGFRIGSERDGYRLFHNNVYFGNAGDSLYSHNESPFSTFDVDNDNRDGEELQEKSCARLYKGGWWYGNCHDCNLNGWYLGGHHRSYADGVNWYTWTGYNYSLKRTVMKFRPRQKGPVRVGYDTFIFTSKRRSIDDDKIHEKDPSAVLMSTTNKLSRPTPEEL